MAKNALSPEQDLTTREFYQVVVNDNDLFPTNPAQQRSLRSQVLRLLNYVVIDGKFVSPDKVSTRKYGEPANVECEWVADTKRAMEALDEDNSGSEDEADSGESTEDTEVRQTLLREDV